MANGSDRSTEQTSAAGSEGKKIQTHFQIGRRLQVPAFVELKELQAHLALLHVFKQVRQDVQDGEELPAHWLVGGQPQPHTSVDDSEPDEQTRRSEVPSSTGDGSEPPPYDQPPFEGLPRSMCPAFYQRVPHAPKAQDKDSAIIERAMNLMSAEMIAATRFKSYLQRAAARFDLYIEHILKDELSEHQEVELTTKEISEKKHRIRIPPARKLDPEQLPPIDVLMVWHSLLLNPSRVWEEGFREPDRALILSYKFPLLEMAACIDAATNRFNTPLAQSKWDTEIPHWSFHLALQPPPVPAIVAFHSGAGPDGVHLACPHCSHLVFVPWTSHGADEFSQGLVEDGWMRICPREACGKLIQLDTLRGRRLLNDLERWADDSNFRIAGSVFDMKTGGILDAGMADAILCTSFYCSPRPEADIAKLRNPSLALEHPATLAARNLMSIDRMTAAIKRQAMSKTSFPTATTSFMLHLGKRMYFFFSQYREYTGSHNSLTDLVGAVQRQFKFVDEMAKLGWSDKENLSNGRNDVTLARSIIRYHSWMDLMARNSALLCPTLDIDLCWHTHMLKRSYFRNMIDNVGRFINHDDKVEENTLSSAFDHTAKLWEKMYGQPYSMCGCIYNKTSLGTRVSKIMSKEGPGSSVIQRLRISKGKPGDQPDEAFEDATHPSAHSSVLAGGKSIDRTQIDVLALSRRKGSLEAVELSEKSGRRRPNHPYAFGDDLYPTKYIGLYPFHYDPTNSCSIVPGADHGVPGSCASGNAWMQNHQGGCISGMSAADEMSGYGTNMSAKQALRAAQASTSMTAHQTYRRSAGGMSGTGGGAASSINSTWYSAGLMSGLGATGAGFSDGGGGGGCGSGGGGGGGGGCGGGG
ncbi:hypothetical protein CF319_g7126 [Tilletia indica]|nr:hypothetical protein CF319_g7126 [Tilletia indica]